MRLVVFSASLYWLPKCLTKINNMLNAKLFIQQKWFIWDQQRITIQSLQPCWDTHKYLNSKENKILWRGEKEVGRAIEMKCSLKAVTVWSLLAFYLTDLKISTGWALKGTEEEDFLLSLWLCYCHRTTELLLLTSWLYFNWGFCLLIFAPSFTHLHPQG